MQRFDWPAFLRASETGQTNRLKCTYAVAHSTSIPEPRSTAPSSVHATTDLLRSAPVSGTLAQCFSFNSESRAERISTRIRNVIAPFLDVQSNVISCGFQKSKAFQFCETPSPYQSIRRAIRQSPRIIRATSTQRPLNRPGIVRSRVR